MNRKGAGGSWINAGMWRIGSIVRIVLIAGLLFLSSGLLHPQDRFPQPDFTSGYTYPAIELAAGEQTGWPIADVAVTAGMLAGMWLLVFHFRSRRGIFFLSLGALLYFGFVRKGCLCPIGSIQIIAEALFREGVSVSWATAALFAIPLVTALFAGRLFCGGVCPLGALQDVVSLKKITIPGWLKSVLLLVPVLYLLLSVTAAATGSDYLICRFDPFIGFFRLEFSDYRFWIYSALFLGLSMLVHRPYCRFLCPYGVLLSLCSRVSKGHLSTSPSDCVDCRLCEESCPQEDLLPPVKARKIESRERKQFLMIVAAVPAVIIIFAFSGYLLGKYGARFHRDVQVLRDVRERDAGGELTLDAEAYLSGNEGVEALEVRAADVEAQWQLAGLICGIIIGITVIFRMFALLRQVDRDGYMPDRGNCTSCGRCMDFCPVPIDFRQEKQ